MAKCTKTDPDQAWIKANASDVEAVTAFKAYSEAHWGMPTFAELRKLIENRRLNAESA